MDLVFNTFHLSKKNKRDIESLIQTYDGFSDEQLQDEIHELVNMFYAILEVTECESITDYINTNTALTVKIEQFKDQSTIKH